MISHYLYCSPKQYVYCNCIGGSSGGGGEVVGPSGSHWKITLLYVLLEIMVQTPQEAIRPLLKGGPYSPL